MSNRYSSFLSIAEAISIVAGAGSEARKHLAVKIERKKKVSSKRNRETKQLLPAEESLKKIVSSELPVKDKKLEKAKKDGQDQDLENDLQADFDEDFLIVDINYSHEEELLIHEIYGSRPLDYVDLFYGGQGPVKFKDKEEYTHLKILSDTEDDHISTLEAEAAIVKVQYAMIMNNREGVDFVSRKKLSNWFTFNTVLGLLYHRLHGVTDEVNYSRVF